MESTVLHKGKDKVGKFSKEHRYIERTEKVVTGVGSLEEKYCSVAATVRATAQITTEIEILEEEPQLAGQI